MSESESLTRRPRFPANFTGRADTDGETASNGFAGRSNADDATDPSPHETNDMNATDQLGHYRITGVIGQGVGGIVYKAFDTSMQRLVALKVLRTRARGAIDPNIVATRVRLQAQAVARLAHPAIVNVHEASAIDGRPCIAMDYVAGMDLDQWLAAAPLPAQPLILQIMDQLLDALESAHRVGLRHGDLKATNVLITTTGAIKITDFGLAQAQNRSSAEAGLAPEYGSGRLIDHRVDIYAAGVLLYRMLAGRDPFSTDAAPDARASLAAMARAPSTFAEAGRPAAFDPVVARAMAREPGQRFSCAADFREALREAGEQRRGVGGITLESSTLRAKGEARDGADEGRAAAVPVLTLAIPDSVLSMPAFDPWAKQLPSRTEPVAEPAPESDMIASDEAFPVLQPARDDALAAAAASAAVSAAAHAAQAARARGASVPPPGLPTVSQGVVITRSVVAPEPSRSDFAPLSQEDEDDGFPRTIHGGDIQLAHPAEGDAIPAEALRRVLRILSAHFGAEAGDVLKRVAGRAGSISELHTLLVEQAGPAIDRKRLAKQLKAIARLPL